MASWPWDAAWLFTTCWLLARVEIEIEGPNGWAQELPTWRYQPRWLLRLTNGKPLTGYHLWLTLFLLAFFHLPLAWGGWSLRLEAAALSRYLLLTCCWDFQWFVWNPAWGPKRFFTEPVWWLKRRVLNLPVEYYLAVAASAALQALLWPQDLGRWAKVAASLLVLSLASAALGQVQRRLSDLEGGHRAAEGAGAAPHSS